MGSSLVPASAWEDEFPGATLVVTPLPTLSCSAASAVIRLPTIHSSSAARSAAVGADTSPIMWTHSSPARLPTLT